MLPDLKSAKTFGFVEVFTFTDDHLITRWLLNFGFSENMRFSFKALDNDQGRTEDSQAVKAPH